MKLDKLIRRFQAADKDTPAGGVARRVATAARVAGSVPGRSRPEEPPGPRVPDTGFSLARARGRGGSLPRRRPPRIADGPRVRLVAGRRARRGHGEGDRRVTARPAPSAQAG